MAEQDGQNGQPRELTEEEKRRMVASLFDDRPRDRRMEAAHRLDARLSVNDGPDIPADDIW